MTNEQIKYMVDRFLNWRLPENFNPDGGISFERFGNKDTPHQYARKPSGTNLLDAAQATEMVRYIMEGLPYAHEEGRRDAWRLIETVPLFGVPACAVFKDELCLIRECEYGIAGDCYRRRRMSFAKATLPEPPK